MRIHLPFEDRLEAGRMLAAELSFRTITNDAVVLALTRGGVPVGFEVADRLRLPLDIVVARKVGVPWQPELAMGAIAGNVRVLDRRTIGQLNISNSEVEEIVAQEQAEMERREGEFRAGELPLDLQGHSAILIDDGLATGSTMVAAVRHTRNLGPQKVIVGVPVGSAEACHRLLGEADDVVCLATPPFFAAVGEWYRNFDQVSDDEVRHLLAESRRRRKAYAASTTAA